MVKTNVKVFVRTRPTTNIYDGIRVQQETSTIHVRVPKSEDQGIVNNQQENFSFKYDGILENVSQDMVYTTAAHEVVDSLLSGMNGTIFCYGQTGAGKTFTMSGDLRHYQHRGLIPQSIHQVFREIDMRVDKMYKVHVSYLELYNDQMYDLLAERPGSSEALAILDDANGGTYVRGLTKVEVASEEEALMQFFAGDQGRSTAGHVLNASSSRSHVIFTLHVEMRTSEAASERAVLSKLHLVDLAGSERTKKTGVSGQALIEAQFINRSLSYLEQTVNALSKREAHVPFRQSKLTSVLRDALGGNCKTVMIANIYAEPSHLEETLSTLRFASRVRTLVTDVGVNESNDPSLLLRRYERQIKELKQELAMRDALSGRGRISYDDLSDVEIRELNALAKKFLVGAAELEELPTDTVRSIREMYKQMRAVFQTVSADMKEQLRQSQTGNGGAVGQVGAAAQDSGPSVGDVESSGRGFAVGNAPSAAKPAYDRSGISSPKAAAMRPAAGGAAVADGTSPSRDGVGNGTAAGGATMGSAAAGGASAAERNAAFSRFKKEIDEGRALAAVVTERTAHLADIKKGIKETSESVNAAKAAIDAVNVKLGAKKALKGAVEGGEDVPEDSEQWALLQELKSSKTKYRTDFDKLKELRNELDPAIVGVAEAKQNLIDEFNRWAGSPMGTFTLSQPADDDELDDGEAFERMQLAQIMSTNPDGAAYHAAMRKVAGGGGAMRKESPGRFGGVKAQAEANRRREQEQAIAAGTVR